MSKNFFLLIFILISCHSVAQEIDVLREFNGSFPLSRKIQSSNPISAIPINDDCSNAITLGVNSACVFGTTDQGSLQVGEPQPSCVTLTFNQSIWYRFVATSSRMYVQLTLNTIIGGSMSSGRWVSAVYHSNSCLPPLSSMISCQTTNSVGTADGIIENIMNGLIVGDVYYIQIGYGIGGGINGVPEFCIKVGDQFSPTCNTCQSPCGQAYGFSTTPTIFQISSNPPFNQTPYSEGSSLVSQCYTFQAVNSTVSFNIIVNSTCGSTGNVTNFSYNLYSSSCGTPIQTGNLSNLTFNNLVPSQWYTFCYSFNVPSGCYHTAYWPYFVGVASLPIELINFNGKFENDKIVLTWSTASEINNDYFIVEKSYDGTLFRKCCIIPGFGTKSTISDYTCNDYDIFNDVIYYRLCQVDYDGAKTVFDPIVVVIDKKQKQVAKIINELGQEVNEDYQGPKFYIYK